MRSWLWLVIVIGIFIFAFFLGGLFSQLFLGKYLITNKYEVFRDILIIVLSLSAVGIALLGLAIYKLISQSLDGKIETKLNEEMNFITCKFYIELSDIYWKHYERDYEIDSQISESEKHYLQMAIEQSERALEKANFLDEKKFESLICVAKNNLAYHLAMRGCPDDDKRAIPLAKYVYDRVWNYDYKETCYWVETYAFVLIRLGDRQQKKKGLKIIEKILTRNDLPDFVREYIQKKYGKALKI